MAQPEPKPDSAEPGGVSNEIPAWERNLVPPDLRTRALIVGVAVAFAGILAGFWYWTRPIPFDSAVWKSESSARQRMVDDLLVRRLLEGMSRAEVDALLGPPTPPDSVREGTYVYWAGSDGVIDDAWLEIEFENDVVRNVRYCSD